MCFGSVWEVLGKCWESVWVSIGESLRTVCECFGVFGGVFGCFRNALHSSGTVLLKDWGGEADNACAPVKPS